MAYYFSYNATGMDSLLNDLVDEKKSILYKKEEFHCTMLYSFNDYTQDKNWIEKISFDNQEVTIRDIEIWEKPDCCYIVARLDDAGLDEINKKLQLLAGIENTQVFKAHISLQKAMLKRDCIKLDEISFLIGKKIELTNFRVIESKSENKKKPKF